MSNLINPNSSELRKTTKSLLKKWKPVNLSDSNTINEEIEKIILQQNQVSEKLDKEMNHLTVFSSSLYPKFNYMNESKSNENGHTKRKENYFRREKSLKKVNESNKLTEINLSDLLIKDGRVYLRNSQKIPNYVAIKHDKTKLPKVLIKNRRSIESVCDDNSNNSVASVIEKTFTTESVRTNQRISENSLTCNREYSAPHLLDKSENNLKAKEILQIIREEIRNMMKMNKSLSKEKSKLLSNKSTNTSKVHLTFGNSTASASQNKNSLNFQTFGKTFCSNHNTNYRKFDDKTIQTSQTAETCNLFNNNLSPIVKNTFNPFINLDISENEKISDSSQISSRRSKSGRSVSSANTTDLSNRSPLPDLDENYIEATISEGNYSNDSLNDNPNHPRFQFVRHYVLMTPETVLPLIDKAIIHNFNLIRNGTVMTDEALLNNTDVLPDVFNEINSEIDTKIIFDHYKCQKILETTKLESRVIYVDRLEIYCAVSYVMKNLYEREKKRISDSRIYHDFNRKLNRKPILWQDPAVLASINAISELVKNDRLVKMYISTGDVKPVKRNSFYQFMLDNASSNVRRIFVEDIFNRNVYPIVDEDLIADFAVDVAINVEINEALKLIMDDFM